MIQRIASEEGVEVQIRPVSVTGGFGKVEKELDEYVKLMLKLEENLPDLMIVVTDSNCQGIQKRRKKLQTITQQPPIADRVIYAIPDPHIERWLLLDSAAFKPEGLLGTRINDPDLTVFFRL